MKKWLIIMGVGILSLMVCLFTLARVMLTKNHLVGMIEKSIDSRVQIGGLDISLFSFPARVELKDVVVVERDDYANNEVPHDERAVLNDGVICVQSVCCDVTLWDLLSRRIRVEEFELRGLQAKAVIYEDGSNSLDAFFDNPDKKGGKRERKERGFNAKDHEGFVTELKKVVVEDCSFELVVEKTGLVIVGEGIGFSFEDIKIDPNELEQVNGATVRMKGKVIVLSNNVERVKFGELGFLGSSQARLFDAVSGGLEPDLNLDLDITEDSYVSTKVPYVDKVWGVTERLKKLGVPSVDLEECIGFGRDRELKASYKKGRVDLLAPISLELSGWELSVSDGSWFQTGDETHEFRVQLIANDKVGSWVLEHMDTVTCVAPKSVRKELKEELIESLWVDKRLTIQVDTKGELSEPKVSVNRGLPDFKKLGEKAVKDYAKRKLFDFARKQLGKDDDE